MSVYSVELYLCLVLLCSVYSSSRVVYNWYWLVMVVNNASCLMWCESTTLCVCDMELLMALRGEGRQGGKVWTITECLSPQPDEVLLWPPSHTQNGGGGGKVWTITGCLSPHPDEALLWPPSHTQNGWGGGKEVKFVHYKVHQPSGRWTPIVCSIPHPEGGETTM